MSFPFSRKIKSLLSFSLKLIILVSFLLPQLFITELFLYQNNIYKNNINIAKADTSDHWYDTTYLYRRKITINHNQIPHTGSTTTLTNFPILISITGDSSLISTNGKVRADFNDVIFASQDGSSPLNYEIESYDSTSGNLTAWIKIPSISDISTSQDTIIYMYYGKSSANTPNTTANIQAVWDDGVAGGGNYKGVWHMKEMGTSPTMNDSTSNIVNSTNQVWTPITSGKIGNAGSFDGIGSAIDFGDINSVEGIGAITVSVWIYPTANNTRGMILAKDALGQRSWYLAKSDSGADNHITLSLGAVSGIIDSTTSVVLNTWNHVVATYNKNGALSTDRLKIYINGSLASGTPTTDRTTDINATTSSLQIGARQYVGTRQYFSGSIDEAHISNIARSADWIKTEYNNQSNAAPFAGNFILPLGSEENAIPPTITSVITSLSSGTYTTGIAIPLTVNFSKAVTSTGNVTVTLNTAPSRSCTFTITNANSGTCTYTTQAGDNTSASLSASISGSISDQFGTAMVNFIPSINISPGKTINIDTTNPAPPAATPPQGTYASGQSVALTLDTDVSSTYYTLDSSTLDNTKTLYNPGDTISIDGTDGSTITLKAISYDAAGNPSTILTSTYTFNKSAPIVTGVTEAGIYNINKTITFNKGTATLDGSAFSSGGTVSVEGSHTLIVTDIGGTTTVHFTIDKTPPASPSATPPQGTYSMAQSVTLNLAGDEAHTYYTLDNSTPDNTKTSYITPISVDGTDGSTIILKAISYDSAGNASSVITANYTFNKSLPQVSGVTEQGTYNTDKTIIFNKGNATLDGSSFSSGDTVSIEGNHTLIVTDISGTTTVHFTIDKTPPASPTATPQEGTYANAQSITLNLAGDANHTYYTLNGDTPDNTKTLYSGAISIDGTDGSTVTIKAISYDSGGNPSSILISIYTFNKSAPTVSGVTEGTVYNTNPTITFNKGTATLDGNVFTSGQTVTTPGTHTLIITDTGGTTTVHFTISSGTVFVPPIKPDTSNIKITNTDKAINISDLSQIIIQFALSITQDFKNTSWQDIKSIQSTLSKYLNNNTLYLKFRTKDGGVSDTITYNPNSNTNSNTNSNNTTIALKDGDIVKTINNPDVYIIKYKNNKQYKRLILSPQVFKSYQHLKWSNIKTISQQELDTFTTSNLVQVKGDKYIYTLTPQGDTGQRQILDTGKAYDQDSVYEINTIDRESYILGK